MYFFFYTKEEVQRRKLAATFCCYLSFTRTKVCANRNIPDAAEEYGAITVLFDMRPNASVANWQEHYHNTTSKVTGINLRGNHCPKYNPK
jgi:hypothetical protein